MLMILAVQSQEEENNHQADMCKGLYSFYGKIADKFISSKLNQALSFVIFNDIVFLAAIVLCSAINNKVSVKIALILLSWLIIQSIPFLIVGIIDSIYKIKK